MDGIGEEGQGLFDEERTGAGSFAATDDEQAAACTGEGYVEQVEVVDGVLQVLVAVVGLKDGAHHLFLTIVDGYDGEVVEGFLRGLAPEDVAAFLQLPVAEGTDNMLVLQAFRLMNREDAYSVGLVALDGLGAERLVPLVEEGSDVGGVLVLSVSCHILYFMDVPLRC